MAASEMKGLTGIGNMILRVYQLLKLKLPGEFFGIA